MLVLRPVLLSRLPIAQLVPAMEAEAAEQEMLARVCTCVGGGLLVGGLIAAATAWQR